jgi:hypothetical protein
MIPNGSVGQIAGNEDRELTLPVRLLHVKHDSIVWYQSAHGDIHF